MLPKNTIYDVRDRGLVKVILHDPAAMVSVETCDGVKDRLVRFDELVQRE